MKDDLISYKEMFNGLRPVLKRVVHKVNIGIHSWLEVDEMQTKEIVQMALKVQDKTQESTARSKNVVQETITVKCMN